MKKTILISAFMIIILSMSNCADDPLFSPVIDNQTSLENANREEFDFVELTFSSLPNSSSFPQSSDTYIAPLDQDSIELFDYANDLHYHPVNLSHRCFSFIGTYFHTQDQKYLQRAEKYASKLLSLCDTVGDRIYAPYTFSFNVHGNPNLHLEAPWYSGMAQGELLEVAIRLYELTGKEEYLQYSDKLFNSFLALKNENEIWTVRIDSLGYYWIEEYPHDLFPGQTLNGYIASLVGIYDYYRVTKKPEAKLIYDLSLTTLKHYFSDFRRENQTSFYCLGHYHLATEGYHNFHITLLGYLYNFTNDEFFLTMKNLFEQDAQAAF